MHEVYSWASSRLYHLASWFLWRPIALSSWTLLVGGMTPGLVLSAEEYFNPYGLQINAPAQALVDLSVFDRGGQMPNTYHVDIYLNNNFVESRNVAFIQQGDKLVPQLTVEQWKSIGLDPKAFPTLVTLPPQTLVTPTQKTLPGVTTHFNFNLQRLDMGIPQMALKFVPRNSVSPVLWDQGISAFLMNYNFSASNTWQREDSGSGNNMFMNLNSGLNQGPWRLRNDSTYTYSRQEGASWDRDGNKKMDTHTQNHWQSINTYAQRDIQPLKSQLTLGESSTPGDVFDSIQFKGIQLTSDDSMLPDSQRGFAPVIHGIANSPAQVTIRQNGAVIYQNYVAAGAFAIRDLYQTSNSGNLEVTIRETDGTEHSFVQPFSAVPLMQRDGNLSYTLTGGQFRSQNDGARHPNFLLANAQYGLSNLLTLYGGGIVSKDYVSGIGGIGQGLGEFGSISLDVTQANTTLQDECHHQGQSYRIQYAKDVLQSGTTFVLTGYRYSTSDFYDFREANERMSRNTDNWLRNYNKRNRMQIQVNQSMGDYGSLYFSGYQQDYWQLSGRELTLSAGYSLTLSGVSYNLNYTNTQTPHNASNQALAFNAQIPLSRFLNTPQRSSSWVSYGMTTSKQSTRQEVGLSGTALENNVMDYSVRESYASQNVGNEGSVNVGYRSNAGRLQGGYNYTRHNSQVNMGMTGAIVVHPYGITLSQQLGNAMALVRAPEASGVRIQNQTGITTDGRGYAVVPYVSPYHENRVALATDTLGENVDLDSAVKTVVPTNGALVLADFKTRIGQRVLIHLTYHDQPIPFGANATLRVDKDTLSSSMVGDNGDVYFTGVPANSHLTVTWGERDNQSCQTPLALPPVQSGQIAPLSLEVQCH